MDIIYILLAMIIIAELSTFLTYGWFVSKKVTETYMNLDEDELELNIYDPSILIIGNTFISTNLFSFTSKYHIDDLGVVPRFSKLEKKN